MNIMKFALVLGFLSFSGTIYAQLFRINVTDYNGTDADATLKAFIDSELKKVQDEINKDLPSAQPDRLMKGMANSSVMSGKGVGSDYASEMDVVLIGAGLGLGVDLEEDKNTKSDISGAGLQGGLIIGLNAGVFPVKRILGLEADRLNLFVNFFRYDLNRSIDKGEIDAQLASYGIHFSYDLIKGSGSSFLGWGGVKLHTGYESNSTRFSFKYKLNETVNSDNGTNTISGALTGTPSAGIKVTTQSIPIEVSSSVRFLYLLSLYGGLGMDINTGLAQGDGGVNAEEAQITCSGAAPCAGNPTVGVTPEANIDAKGKADSFFTRAFVGLQVNLPFTRIFVQADKPFGNKLVGATAGLRFVY